MVAAARRVVMASATCASRPAPATTWPESPIYPDLVLAVDVFPYLVPAARTSPPGMSRKRPGCCGRGGSLVILNFSYRGDAADRHDMPGLAAAQGFALLRNGTREFVLWDGLAFELRRAA